MVVNWLTTVIKYAKEWKEMCARLRLHVRGGFMNYCMDFVYRIGQFDGSKLNLVLTTRCP